MSTRHPRLSATVWPAPRLERGYDGYFADPDGHLWEIARNPAWTITDRGDTLLKKPG